VTTLETSLNTADCEFGPSRLDTGVSTNAGDLTAEDLGVPLNQTFTGWLTGIIARLRPDHPISVAVIAPEQPSGRGSSLQHATKTRSSRPGTAWRSVRP
jgi:hypothetical protein